MKDIELTFEYWQKNPTPSNTRNVLDSMSGDIDRSIQSAGGQPSALTRGFAKNIVLGAMKSYQPDRGAKFRSWAQTQLRSLVRPVRQSRFSIKIPELRAREASRVRSVIEELQAETGYEPSDSTISDKLGIPIDHVQRARGGPAPEVVGNEMFGAAKPDENTEESQLVKDMVYHSLGPRDQVIMEYATGYNGVKALPSVDIARKLKITPAAVSQHLAKIREMLIEAEETV